MSVSLLCVGLASHPKFVPALCIMLPGKGSRLPTQPSSGQAVGKLMMEKKIPLINGIVDLGNCVVGVQ